MPTSTVPSASGRSHSCDLVYLSSSGTFFMLASFASADQSLAEAHERRLHHARVEKLAAYLDLHAGEADGRHPRECDRALERRGEAAAGDLALAAAGNEQLLVTAQHAAVLEHEAYELARRAVAYDRFQRLAADEGALA